MRLHASDLIYLSPELTLVAAAVILTLLDLMLPERASRKLLAYLSLLAVAVSAAFVVHFVLQLHDGMRHISLLANSYRIDQFANLFKLLMLTGTAFVIMISIGTIKHAGVQHRSEYYYLLLPAVLGGMIMASSADLITLFVGLELLSITSYILVGIRKKHLQASEAAFKYLVLGGIASAIILYGMSFLYGLSGSTNVEHIYRALSTMHPSWGGMIYISFIFILTGMAFKIAAAPFHTWAPEVYDGAAVPVTTFLAVVSKAAGFAMLFRIVYNVYYGAGTEGYLIFQEMFFVISILAAAAMIIGNTAALHQRNIKRLLAYSAVANSGYLLVPLALHFNTVHYANFAEFYFYMVAYLFMTTGAFAVLLTVTKDRGPGAQELDAFAGLYYRAPFTAAAMTIFLISLAGLPISAGFIGKLYILLGTLQMREFWLAAVILLTSVVSYCYYFRIIRHMYMRADRDTPDKITVPLPTGIVIWLCAFSTVILGLFPQWLLDPLEQIFHLLGDLFVG